MAFTGLTLPGEFGDPRAPLPPGPTTDDVARANKLATLREHIDGVIATITAMTVLVARLKHEGIDADEPYLELHGRATAWLQQKQAEYDRVFRGLPEPPQPQSEGSKP